MYLVNLIILALPIITAVQNYCKSIRFRLNNKQHNQNKCAKARGNIH